jgi:hypothetical protein
MGISGGAAAFKLQFQLSPIVMTGGIASGIIGGVLPLIQLVSGLAGTSLVGESSFGDSLDDAFAFFQPLPGGTLIDQQIGMYPFANQKVAANAVIQQPLSISMLMICPAGRGGGYASKFGLMQAMQASFKAHNVGGGLYDIMTPSYVYTNCVMTNMTDVSSSMTKQVQNAYKLDFLQPLVTLADAAGAQSALMNSITNGTPTNGALSGQAGVAGVTTGATAPSFLGNNSGQGASSVGGGAP